MSPWLDREYTLDLLRKTAAGHRLPAAQLQYLEEGGFICATDDGNHHLTTHGALTLKKGNH